MNRRDLSKNTHYSVQLPKMAFWTWNARRLPAVVILAAILSGLATILLGAFGVLSLHGVLIPLFALFIFIYLTGLYVSKTIRTFIGTRHLIMTGWEWCIQGLFDDGFITIPQKVSSVYKLVTPEIHGRIAGFPVIVTYRPKIDHDPPMIRFDFFPIYGPNDAEPVTETLTIDLDRDNEKRGLKPIVSFFTTNLIGNGFHP
ncbi:MAG: hypothetical protein JNM41_05530 [Flavipsychrobacter sp.]|nr:hypothetical protein [Flavipsychrobacter sp.]